MRSLIVLLFCGITVLVPACKRSPKASTEADVQARLRQALEQPLPEAARLTSNPPRGPVSGDGERLAYGMRAMTQADVQVQPYIQRYMQDSRDQRSTQILEQALEVVPDHEDVLALLAMARVEQGRLPEALATFERLIEVHDKPQAPAFAALAGLQGEIGDLEAALRTAEQGLVVWPHHARLEAVRGAILMESGAVDDAVLKLEAAHRLHADDPAVSLALARAYAAAGHHIFAMQMAEVAFWTTKEVRQRRAASQLIHDSLTNNVVMTPEGVRTSLVPTAPRGASLDLISDTSVPWDQRLEASLAVAASLNVDAPKGSAEPELVALANLRILGNRLAVAALPDEPVHPTAAIHVRADLEGCALGYHASVLGLHDGSFERWFEANEEAGYAVASCADKGLFDQPAGWDLTRQVWGSDL